jgi:hypothetical protein
MKMSEILKILTDISNGSSVSTNSTMSRVKPVEVESPADVEGAVMVPPLQAKLELLKKSVGVENVYDECEPDELAVIKKNAGLTAAQHEASDDEPLDN